MKEEGRGGNRSGGEWTGGGRVASWGTVPSNVLKDYEQYKLSSVSIDLGLAFC